MPGTVLGWIAVSGDSFLRPILDHLAKRYAIKEVRQWPDAAVDLLWCEWGDRGLVEATAKSKTCPIVARIHSYEVFREAGDLLSEVDWSKVDAVVFVAEHVRDFALARHDIRGPEILVIPNGVDLDRFTLPPGKVYGKKVAWVGGVSFKKGPELFAQAAAAIHAFDPEFEFHVAGEVQQDRYEAYFRHILPRLGLEAVVRFHGAIPPERMPAFLQGMDYVLSTSPWEGTQQSVAEAIACGGIPLVHDWPGAERVYPFLAGELWRTPAELVGLVARRRLRPEDRAHLVPLAEQLRQIDGLVARLLAPKVPVSVSNEPLWMPCEQPLVSAAIIVKNEAENLERCLRSIRDVVDEVVLLDTGSTDETMEIGRRLGARVYEEAWQDDFSLHRNHSMDLCRGKWILVIDGDEELAEAGNLAELLRGRADVEGAEGVVLHVEACSRGQVEERLVQIRGLKKGTAHYRYPVHNRLCGVTRAIASGAVLRSEYADPRKDRFARSIPLLERLARESPDDSHALFYLAMTFSMIGVAREGT